jgi:hypothetical protein
MKSENSENKTNRNKGEEPSVYAAILVVTLLLGVISLILKALGVF